MITFEILYLEMDQSDVVLDVDHYLLAVFIRARGFDTSPVETFMSGLEMRR